jgi:kynureninase
MPDQFQPIPTAEAWQMSNAPVFSMAPLLASLELFEAAGGMAALRQESLRLTAELWALLSDLPKNQVRIITPAEPERRGCQLSLQIPGGNKSLFQRLTAQGVIADWREPDVIRIAPVPLYNNSEDLQQFVQKLRNCLG